MSFWKMGAAVTQLVRQLSMRVFLSKEYQLLIAHITCKLLLNWIPLKDQLCLRLKDN